jgi:hypothetical protein
VTFEYGDNEALEIDGQKYRLSGTGKGQINLGLSKAGWLKLLELVGRSRLVSFLLRLGGRVLPWLAAEGIIVGVAVLGSLALTGLVAWAYNKALTPDESRLALDWYVYGYTHAIFHDGSNRSPQPRHEEMRVLGEQDAVADGRRMLREAGDPSAEDSPRAVLLASRYLICQWYLETYQWGETKAEWHFTQELRTLAAQKMAGR